MPLFRHNGEIHYFAHIPKNAGTAVRDALDARFGPMAFINRENSYVDRWTRTPPQHVLWRDLERLVPEDWLASSFAIVRHPFARFVSAYNFRARGGAIPAGLGPEAWFRHYLARHEVNPFAHGNHLSRQVDFLPSNATVFHIENGTEEIAAWLNERFGTDPTPFDLPRRNVSPKTPDARYTPYSTWSPEFRELLRTHYAADFERFGYENDPSKLGTASVPNGTGASLARRPPLALSRYYASYGARRLRDLFKARLTTG